MVGARGPHRGGHQERPLRRPVGLPRAGRPPLGPPGHLGGAAEPGLRLPVPDGPVLRGRRLGRAGLGGPAALVEPGPDRRPAHGLRPAAGAAGRRPDRPGRGCPGLHPEPAGALDDRRPVVRGAAGAPRAGDPATRRARDPGPPGAAPGRGALRARGARLRRGQRDGDRAGGAAGRPLAADPAALVARAGHLVVVGCDGRGQRVVAGAARRARAVVAALPGLDRAQRRRGPRDRPPRRGPRHHPLARLRRHHGRGVVAGGVCRRHRTAARRRHRAGRRPLAGGAGPARPARAALPAAHPGHRGVRHRDRPRGPGVLAPRADRSGPARRPARGLPQRAQGRPAGAAAAGRRPRGHRGTTVGGPGRSAAAGAAGCGGGRHPGPARRGRPRAVRGDRAPGHLPRHGPAVA